MKFEIYEDSKSEYRWRLKATNGQIIATSGEGYKNKTDCSHMVSNIKKDAEDAEVTDLTLES